MSQNANRHDLLDRRSLLKSAGAFLGLSRIFEGFTMNTSDQSQSKASGPVPSKNMLGFMLAHEQFTVPQLIEFGAAAEQAGFDFVANSDHLQPWQANEGHAGMSWLTMSALGQKTTIAFLLGVLASRLLLGAHRSPRTALLIESAVIAAAGMPQPG